MFPSGTRIAVRDLFGSMPVRVKQRAMEMERLGSAKSFDQLVFMTVALLLAWPTAIVVSLQDVISNRTVVLRTSDLSKAHNQMVREIPSRTCSLLGQASLLEQQDPKSWVSIGASVTGLSLSGCVCLVPIATKKVQFMALGIRPLLNENQSNVLYEEVNKVFANSRFGEIEEVELDEDGVPKKTEGFTAKELKPKRGLDRWPMFFIQITLEDQMQSLNTDGLIDGNNHNLAMITDLLQVMVYEFLKKHSFRPKAVNAFDRLKQPKSSSSKALRSHSKKLSVAALEKHTRKSSSRSPARLESSKSRGSSRSQPPGVSRSPSGSPFTSWTQTKHGSRRSIPSQSSKTPPNCGQLSGVTKRSNGPQSGDTSAQGTSTLLLEMVKHQNLSARKEVTAFEPVELPIPRIPELLDTYGQGYGGCDNKSGGFGNIHLASPNGAGASMTTFGRISKHALQNAEIIGQVDKKFILAKLSTSDNFSDRSLLIMIDQHAADERCGVEDLMCEYFWSPGEGRTVARSQIVSQPLRFDLSQQEGALMARYQRHLEHWGVRYEVFSHQDHKSSRQGTVSKTATVEIQSLPPSILERCRLEPRLLIDLLRKEIWKLHDNPGLCASGSSDGALTGQGVHGNADWVARFHGCPDGILEMINSRACRSMLSSFTQTLWARRVC